MKDWNLNVDFSHKDIYFTNLTASIVIISLFICIEVERFLIEHLTMWYKKLVKNKIKALQPLLLLNFKGLVFTKAAAKHHVKIQPSAIRLYESGQLERIALCRMQQCYTNMFVISSRFRTSKVVYRLQWLSLKPSQSIALFYQRLTLLRIIWSCAGHSVPDVDFHLCYL